MRTNAAPARVRTSRPPGLGRKGVGRGERRHHAVSVRKAALPYRALADEAGQAIVIVALSCAALLMTVGLAIDVGRAYGVRRTMQEAADAGAYAGAVVLYQQGTAAEARSAATADTTRNGYSTGGTVTVTVNLPPTSGPEAGNNSMVEVIIEDRVQTMLLPGPGLSVRVRAVGGSTPLTTGHAILTLKPTGNDTFKVSGGTAVNVLNGGIQVNSNDRNAAAHISGDGGVNATYTRIVGGYQDSGPGNFNPAPTTGVNPDPDVLATLPLPPTAGLTYRGFVDHSSSSNRYLDPGIYDGIKLGGDGTLYLRPGIYILRDKAFQVSGNGTVAMDPASPATDGVLLFNTMSNYSGAGGNCDKFQFSGNGSLRLRAQSSGVYAGVLFYQDPRCDKEFYISGNGSMVVETRGTIYLPTAGFHISGNGAFNSIGQIVAQTFLHSGDASFQLTYDAGAVAAALVPALVE